MRTLRVCATARPTKRPCESSLRVKRAHPPQGEQRAHPPQGEQRAHPPQGRSLWPRCRIQYPVHTLWYPKHTLWAALSLPVTTSKTQHNKRQHCQAKVTLWHEVEESAPSRMGGATIYEEGYDTVWTTPEHSQAGVHPPWQRMKHVHPTVSFCVARHDNA
jgi:hypothetical protein